MTREQAIRTVNELAKREIIYPATGLFRIPLQNDMTFYQREQNEACAIVAAWLREIADALAGGPTDAK